MLKQIEKISLKFEDLIKKRDPIKVLASGYLAYMLCGFLLLLLPFSTVEAVSLIDNLFTAVSAVSTTGLVTVDPGQTYSFFGELVVLILIQLGGIGYMTFGSFIILQTGHRISKTREKMTRTAFPLPESLDISSFIKGVLFFTVAVEFIGAVLLSIFFWLEGLNDPIWNGVFHSISAFCTAGFSLNPDSFESFANHLQINVILSILSMMGAIGFIVAVDFWLKITNKKKHLLFTSKVILLITSVFLVGGTAVFYLIEPSVANMPFGERLLVSFFQIMTSTSTVGFNTIDVGSLSTSSIMLLYFLMIFGASPSGTGGGLKSTTFSALFSLVKGTLKRSEVISSMGRKIPAKRLQFACSAFVFCGFILGSSIFFLGLTESAEFEILVFEAISALGTVGMSMGLTGSLSSLGKCIIIILMIIGRIGVLTFGLAVSTIDSGEPVDGDCDLVV